MQKFLFFCERMDIEGLGVSVDLGSLPNVLSKLSARIAYVDNNQKELAAFVGMSE